VRKKNRTHERGLIAAARMQQSVRAAPRHAALLRLRLRAHGKKASQQTKNDA
jgi:hypothetical protein